jgi:hypothetical protein
MRMRIVGGSSLPPALASEARRAAAARKSTGRIRVSRISQVCQVADPTKLFFFVNEDLLFDA